LTVIANNLKLHFEEARVIYALLRPAPGCWGRSLQLGLPHQRAPDTL